MSKAFFQRDAHRRALNFHVALLVFGLGAAFVINRFVTPDKMWAQWVALGWGVAFTVHLIVFTRGTLATMGRKR